MPPALRTALELLRLGLWPIPITPIDDPGPAAGKRPIGEAWGRSRNTAATLGEAWARQPRAGVGLQLGAEAGVIDVEIDDPERGEATLATLFGGEVIPTRGWSSRRGGHRLFRWDDRLRRYGKSVLKVDGVEIRVGALEPGGKQLQSVVPPSPDAEGRPREWNGIEEIASLPAAFFDHLDHLFTASVPVEERARRYLDKLPEAIEGERGHDRLYRAACVLVDGFALDDQQALILLREWNQAKAFPPESDAQLVHKLADARKNTSRSGHLLNGAGLTKETKYTKKAPIQVGSPPVAAAAGGVSSSTSFLSSAPRRDDPEVPVTALPFPAPPEEAAFYGDAGDLARLIGPQTEADPVGILAQFLVGFGNLIGRTAFVRLEDCPHYANLFVTVVGQSSKARKGTGWWHARTQLRALDGVWAETRVMTGLSSGEGLIWSVRDPIHKREPVRDKRRITGYQDVEVDAGIADKRILAYEPEMASVFQAIDRETNTLSAILRRAWDDGNLRTLTKNSPAVATGAHASIVAHITADELVRCITETQAANGFGNRFLWVCVRRTQLLPLGGRLAGLDFAPIQYRLARAVAAARGRGEMSRDPEADHLWCERYEALTEAKPGLLGAMVARGEAQVMRLALVYALIDGDEAIRRYHLEAALALWAYVEESVRFLFGEELSDPAADALLKALRASPVGLSRTEISEVVFQRNKSSRAIAEILGRFVRNGLAFSETVPTAGRPAEVWSATPTKETK